jgi:IS30 family transposase
MEWFLISDLLGLPGIPTSKSGFLRFAKKRNLKKRDYEGNGGNSYQYHFDSLPPITQAALTRSQKVQQKNECSNNNFVPIQEQDEPIKATRSDSIKAWAYCEIQRSFQQFWAECRDCQITKLEAELQFCTLYNQRELTLVDQCYQLVPRLSRATLQRKRQISRQYGIAEMGREGVRVGLIDRTPALQEAIETCLCAGGTDWKPGQIRLVLQQNYPDLPLPSDSQIRRWVQKFAQGNPAKYKRYQGEKVYKNQSMPAFGLTDLNLNRPNQLWELDSSPTDITLQYIDTLTGEVKKKRHSLVAAIDVFSRRCKLLVVPTSKASAIKLLLRNAIADWGIPEGIKIDNGKDYKSVAVQRFCSDLSIAVDFCEPFSPWQKPHVERFFKTFQHSELELLPGFVGHSVGQREKMRSREGFNETTIELEMTIEDFQAWCDDWCKKEMLRPHKGLERKAPIEQMQLALSYGWEKRVITDQRKLDLLCLEVDSRKVQKQGIQLENRYYVASELGAMIGQTVWVRFDPAAPDEIFVYSDENASEYFCVAKWQNAYSPDELAEVAQMAKATANAQTKTAEVYKKAKKLNQKLAETPARLINKDGDIQLIEPKQEFTTPAIEGVTQTLQRKAPAPLPNSPDAEIVLQRAKEACEAKQQPIKREVFDSASRYDQLLQRELEGEQLNDTDKGFIAYYEKPFPKIREITIAKLSKLNQSLKYG